MSSGVRQKIHLVHLTSAPGGLEVLLSEIVRSLPACDFKAFVIRPLLKGVPDVYAGTGVERTYGSANNLIAVIRLWKYVSSNRKDIFHLFNTGPLFLLVMRLAGAGKLVYSIHGTVYWNTKFQKVIRKMIWKLALSDKYIFTANSSYSKRVFLDTVCKLPQNIEVVYNPISVNPVSMAGNEKRKEHFRIGYAGRLVEGKNLFLWLKVAQRISSVFTDASFRLYGDGMLKDQLVRYCDELEITDRVKFEGFVKDISKAYSDCDLMVFLSERESFGNVVVESVLCGTPALVSDIPAFREIMINWPQYIIPKDSHPEEAVLEKIRHFEDLKRNLPAMTAEFKTRFSAAQHGGKISKLYEAFPA
jgi:glycosyltransferase involved in cell wall biosynthesis